MRRTRMVEVTGTTLGMGVILCAVAMVSAPTALANGHASAGTDGASSHSSNGRLRNATTGASARSASVDAKPVAALKTSATTGTKSVTATTTLARQACHWQELLGYTGICLNGNHGDKYSDGRRRQYHHCNYLLDSRRGG